MKDTNIPNYSVTMSSPPYTYKYEPHSNEKTVYHNSPLRIDTHLLLVLFLQALAPLYLRGYLCLIFG